MERLLKAEPQAENRRTCPCLRASHRQRTLRHQLMERWDLSLDLPVPLHASFPLCLHHHFGWADGSNSSFCLYFGLLSFSSFCLFNDWWLLLICSFMFTCLHFHDGKERKKEIVYELLMLPALLAHSMNVQSIPLTLKLLQLASLNEQVHQLKTTNEDSIEYNQRYARFSLPNYIHFGVMHTD